MGKLGSWESESPTNSATHFPYALQQRKRLPLPFPLEVCPMGSKQAPYKGIFDKYSLQTHGVCAGFASF